MEVLQMILEGVCLTFGPFGGLFVIALLVGKLFKKKQKA